MQPVEQVAQRNGERRKRTGEERKRVETVVETLATLRSQGETLSEVAHDARNMVTALGLYCDLLEEPGVLAAPYAHYGSELRLVAAASRHLVEKLVMLDAQAVVASPLSGAAALPGGQVPLAFAGGARALEEPGGGAALTAGPSLLRGPGANPRPGRRVDMLPAMPLENLAAELLASRNLLSALAGPSIALTMDTKGGARPVRITGEDLTRVLVNLVKNASEAMPAGGRIHVTLSERPQGAGGSVVLTVEDNGPGIPVQSREEIFASGYTTRGSEEPGSGSWPSLHRGLGLAITRSIVEAAGGRICARNREPNGACIEIELPVRNAGNREQGAGTENQLRRD